MQGNRKAAKAVCFQQKQTAFNLRVESISLFSLERGGRPTDRPAKPLRLDDVEGVGSGEMCIRDSYCNGEEEAE